MNDVLGKCVFFSTPQVGSPDFKEDFILDVNPSWLVRQGLPDSQMQTGYLHNFPTFNDISKPRNL